MLPMRLPTPTTPRQLADSERGNVNGQVYSTRSVLFSRHGEPNSINSPRNSADLHNAGSQNPDQRHGSSITHSDKEPPSVLNRNHTVSNIALLERHNSSSASPHDGSLKFTYSTVLQRATADDSPTSYEPRQDISFPRQHTNSEARRKENEALLLEKARQSLVEAKRLAVGARQAELSAKMREVAAQKKEFEAKYKEVEAQRRLDAARQRELEACRKEEEAKRNEEEVKRNREQATKREEIHLKEMDALKREDDARKREEDALQREILARQKEEVARRFEEEARRKEEEAKRKEEEAGQRNKRIEEDYERKKREIERKEAELREREVELLRKEQAARLAQEEATRQANESSRRRKDERDTTRLKTKEETARAEASSRAVGKVESPASGQMWMGIRQREQLKEQRCLQELRRLEKERGTPMVPYPHPFLLPTGVRTGAPGARYGSPSLGPENGVGTPIVSPPAVTHVHTYPQLSLSPTGGRPGATGAWYSLPSPGPENGVGAPIVPPFAVTHVHTYPHPSLSPTSVPVPRTDQEGEPLPHPFGTPTQYLPPEHFPVPTIGRAPLRRRPSLAPTIVAVTGPEPIHPPDYRPGTSPHTSKPDEAEWARRAEERVRQQPEQLKRAGALENERQAKGTKIPRAHQTLRKRR